MRSKIAACALTMGMFLTASVLAGGPDAKPRAASPVARAQQPHRVRVKEDVQKRKLVQMVFAVYPPASAKHMDGTVVLRVLVGKNGAVNSAKYVSGPTNLMASAVNAVLQWRYKPTMMNGLPVEVDTTVSVVFPPLATGRPPVAKQ